MGLWLSAIEHAAYRSSGMANQPLEPIFIIGHWRSGTTFLHELLCATQLFNFPSTYACMNPQVFPFTEAAMIQHHNQRSIERPMDHMLVSLASPQEDEFALLALGARSPYEGLLFPMALERAMATADPNDLSNFDRDQWISIFTRFLGQVAKRMPSLPVLMKSPTHSFRVDILGKIFPAARFIHLVRNPHEVFNSTLHMWNKLFDLYALTGSPTKDILTRQVIANWIHLEEKLDAAVPNLEAPNYVRIRYEDLAANPLMEVERIFGQLSLKGLRHALRDVEAYLATRTDFRKNQFEHSAETGRRISSEWRSIFDKYGYANANLRA